MLGSDIATFIKHGVIRLQDVRGLNERILRILPEMDRFMEQHSAEKERWSFYHDVKGDPDTGYILKSGSKRKGDTPEDYKELFHYRTSLPGLLRERGVDFSPYTAMLEDCDTLNAQCNLIHCAMLAKLDAYMGSDFAGQFNAVDSAHQVLRVLYYRGRRDDCNEEIGQAHIDRNSVTLALYESHAGLQAEFDGMYHDVSSEEDAPLWFAGGKLCQSSGIPALWHRVVQDPSLRNQRAVDRRAIVHFGHHHGLPYDGPTHR